MTEPINLDGLRMHAVETASNGVIDADTYFEFHQCGKSVWAEYAGGRIIRGYLVGTLDGDELVFRFCQHEVGDNLSGGFSTCRVEHGMNSPTRLIERFEWESREGSGTNVIQEAPGA